MSGRRHDLVIEVLRQPEQALAFDGRQWDLLLRQAASANLSCRLAALFDARGLAAAVPAGPAAHLDGARRLARTKHAEVRREVVFIQRALEHLGLPLLLLKGAAYVLAGLPAAQGRLFADVDILVPKARLADVEAALMLAGWAGTHHSPYDQRYYRQWMHELPPLVHLRRQTSLDVHHAISPETARWRADSAPLFAHAVALPGTAGLAVLAPADMVLHSMVHLLLNDELSHGLRDLSDIDLLLRHFSADPAFWPQLTARAAELGLGRALHHGLHCVTETLATPVPQATLAAVAAWGPGAPARLVLQAAWRRALRSPHPSAAQAGTRLALAGLVVRAHWLRMPPLLLARHLAVKALGLNKPPPPEVAVKV